MQKHSFGICIALVALFIVSSAEDDWSRVRTKDELAAMSPEELEAYASYVSPNMTRPPTNVALPYTAAYPLKKVLYTTKSKFQEIKVVASKGFGNILVIDGDLMLSQRDEFHYHEMMAHIPLNYFPNAERALVIGGGDGGTLLQVLRHPNLKGATLVDIDEAVVETSKKYFKNTAGAGSFGHPKATVLHVDGAKWARDACDDPNMEKFDVIIIDSTDYNAAVPLFQDSFYRDMKRCVLKEGGILTHNLDSLCWDLDTVYARTERLSKIFKHVHIDQVFQPTYSGGHYAIEFCSDSVHPTQTPIDWDAWHAKNISTRYYNPDVHVTAWALPTFVRSQVPLDELYLNQVPNLPPTKE